MKYGISCLYYSLTPVDFTDFTISQLFQLIKHQNTQCQIPYFHHLQPQIPRIRSRLAPSLKYPSIQSGMTRHQFYQQIQYLENLNFCRNYEGFSKSIIFFWFGTDFNWRASKISLKHDYCDWNSRWKNDLQFTFFRLTNIVSNIKSLEHWGTEFRWVN